MKEKFCKNCFSHKPETNFVVTTKNKIMCKPCYDKLQKNLNTSQSKKNYDYERKRKQYAEDKSPLTDYMKGK